MHLRSLTLRGFKSFANKSVLKFEPGITIVVGPNGSGKSNITDAVLWVLGEQSPRTLRGASMEDVIFAGSGAKQPLSAAEVSLTLNNDDGAIPIDYAEVTITRRLFRSGESDYFINRSPCRLLDIQELLSDSGLGREMYSIISQGRLDDILSCGPEERRQLIEEAAGVLKHRKRKERALRKLRSMEANVTRARDILREINRQVAPLEKQAERARQHAELSAELREAQVAHAVVQLEALKSEWNDLLRQENDQRERLSGLRDELSAAETTVAELEDQLEAKGLIVGDIGEHRRRLQAITERINSGLLLLEEKGKNLIGKASELRQKIYQRESKKRAAEGRLAELQADKVKADDELQTLYSRLAAGRRQAEQVKKDGRAVAAGVAEAEKALTAESQERARLDRDLVQLASRLESNKKQAEFLQAQRDAIAAKRQEVEERRQGLNTEQALQARERPTQAGKLERLQRQIDRHLEIGDQLSADANELAHRQHVAEAQIAALESVARSVAPPSVERLKEVRGVVGLVGELLRVPQKYERAVEAALGAELQAAVTDDLKATAQAYDVLRHGEQSASLVPSAPLGQEPVGVDVEMASGGVVAAMSVVECDDAVRLAIERLLGHVLIVESLLPVIKRGGPPAGYVAVDLEGHLMTDRGVVRKAGARHDVGILGSRRQLETLHRERAKLAQEIKSRRTKLDKTKAELASLQQDALAVTAVLQRVDGNIMRLTTDINHLDEQATALAAQEVDVAKQLESIEQTAVKDRADHAEAAARLETMGQRLAAREAELVSAKRELDHQAAKERRAAGQLSDSQVAIASLTERQISLKTQVLNLTEELKEATELLSSEEKIIGALESLRGRIQPVHDCYTQLRLKAEFWVEKLEQLAADEQADVKAVRERIRSEQDRSRQLGTEIDQAGGVLTEVEVAKAETQMRVNAISGRLVDELDVSLESALATSHEESETDYRQREKRLKSRLEAMGPVNPMAMEEYQELKERQDFLNDQISDLSRAQRAMMKIVSAIDAKIKAQFLATFTLVATNFRQVFADLFPGGDAGLVLIEADELLESGVDIQAQPYGKRLQSLALLSGGERSLVGLALLFALYKTRPSPFCILDEVEAALDDINLQRVINLLDKHKAGTQFLVITHQRRTMEIADCLYGVSMQADGVSRCFSQKLKEADATDRGYREAELVPAAVEQSKQVQEQL